MSLPERTAMHIGDLALQVMTFRNKGDILPMHKHGEEDIHITVVARGRIRVEGETFEAFEASAGSVVDFEIDHPHEITALEANSRIVNVLKNIRKAR